jgi:hypothetical protein
MRLLLVATAALALLAASARADTAPPAVASSFQEGQALSGKVTWAALASGAELDHVEFVVDGWLRHTENAAPYTFEWDTTREANGPHTLDLWAVARDGRIATQTLHVVVQNAFSLAFGTLRDGQSVSGKVDWRARLDGIDAEWVEFLVDGRLAFTEQQAPYGESFDTTELANGQHTLTLWAVATNGRTATASIRVTVRNGGLDVAPDALVSDLRGEVWRLQSLMRVPRTPSLPTLQAWQKKAAVVRRQASRPPHWTQFLCIHRYEGAWNANTGNGYFGGLQMNRDFMRGYGPELLAKKGTADTWLPLEQIWVAERAWKVRGFQPWPQTARMCGLLPGAA